MKKSILAFAVLGASAALACAQAPGATDRVRDAAVAKDNGCHPCSAQVDTGVGSGSRAGIPGGEAYIGLAGEFGAVTLGRQYNLDYLALADVGDPFKGGTAGRATDLVGNGDRSSDNTIRYHSVVVRGVSAGASYSRDTIEGNSASRRAWGLSVGFERGPFTFRAAHQNLQVAKVRMYDQTANRMDAKNSIVAANLRLGWGTAYAAYSVSRGWGSSPLFNPDNPYGARIATTPSTDSRDILVGLAVPVGRATTLLASFLRKNDRDLANQDAKQLAIGATYAVSRRMDFYAAYSRIQNINAAAYSVDNASAGGKGTSAVNVGMRRAF
jgi:predicted porin